MGADGSRQDPWERLREAVAYAFTSADPDLPAPPVPKQLTQWGELTSISMGCGIAYSGVREWLKVRMLPEVEYPTQAVNKAQAARLIAEENTLRVLRVQRAAVKGGVRFGGLAGVFFASQISAEYARQLHDVWNIVIGGSVAGAALGLMLPNSMLYKAGSIISGGLGGAAVSYPVGALQLTMESWYDELAKTYGIGPTSEEMRRTLDEPEYVMVEGQYLPILPSSPAGTTDGVIAALERNLTQTEGLAGVRGQHTPAVPGKGESTGTSAEGGGGGWLRWIFRRQNNADRSEKDKEPQAVAELAEAPGGRSSTSELARRRELLRADDDRSTKSTRQQTADYRFWPFVK